jgi:hypothetical protein
MRTMADVAAAADDDERAARGRHPTALWVPDVERMRRRLAARDPDVPVTDEAYPGIDAPA